MNEIQVGKYYKHVSKEKKGIYYYHIKDSEIDDTYGDNSIGYIYDYVYVYRNRNRTLNYSYHTNASPLNIDPDKLIEITKGEFDAKVNVLTNTLDRIFWLESIKE